MLRKIYKILPLFLVEYIARKKCEKIDQGGVFYYVPFEDVLIKEKH